MVKEDPVPLPAGTGPDSALREEHGKPGSSIFAQDALCGDANYRALLSAIERMESQDWGSTEEWGSYHWFPETVVDACEAIEAIRTYECALSEQRIKVKLYNPSLLWRNLHAVYDPSQPVGYNQQVRHHDPAAHICFLFLLQSGSFADCSIDFVGR